MISSRVVGDEIALENSIILILSFIIGLWSNISIDHQSSAPTWFNGLKETCPFIGTLFLNGLKMVVIPLVVTSIICGVSKIGGESGFGRLGLKTMGFYALTGFCCLYRTVALIY